MESQNRIHSETYRSISYIQIFNNNTSCNNPSNPIRRLIVFILIASRETTSRGVLFSLHFHLYEWQVSVLFNHITRPDSIKNLWWSAYDGRFVVFQGFTITLTQVLESTTCTPGHSISHNIRSYHIMRIWEKKIDNKAYETIFSDFFAMVLVLLYCTTGKIQSSRVFSYN